MRPDTGASSGQDGPRTAGMDALPAIWANVEEQAHGQPQVSGMFGWSFALQAVAACQDAWVWRSDNSGFKPPELLQGLKQPLT